MLHRVLTGSQGAAGNIHGPGRLLIAATSGALLAFSFPPYPLHFVSSIALTPLLYLWHGAGNARRAFIDSYAAFQVTFLIAFAWPLLHERPATAFASLTGVVLIPMTMAIPFAASLPVRQRLGPFAGSVALVSFYLLQEAFWLYGPLAMPGALLGHSLSHLPSINQFADLAGVGGLSLWVLALNLLAFHAVIFPQHRGRLAGAGTVLILAATTYSAWRLQQHRTTDPGATTSILLVQPGVPAEHWTRPDDPLRLDAMIHLTDSLLQQINSGDLLAAWPETSIPLAGSAEHETSLLDTLRQWVSDRGITLVAGAVTRSSADVDPSVAFSNSAVLIAADAETLRYDKNILVPFAEHVPFESMYPDLGRFRVDAGGVAGYQPGTNRPMFTHAGTPFGVMICFESLFGHVARSYVRQGAALLVVLSNIGWWGPRIAPAQYLAFTRLRAIETRRAVVVDTVSGISALILPSGDLDGRLGWMQHGGRLVVAPTSRGQTIYVLWGDVLYGIALLVTALVVLKMLYERRVAPTRRSVQTS